jgi:DNA-binding GntR family transcriptional regulator
MANRDALSGELVDTLREEILGEQRKPGAKLTEEEIAADFGMSRTPVRDAIRQLAQENLVELIPNRGAFVIGFSRGDVSDLFDLRRDAEVLAIRWAVDRFYKEELDRFEEIYEELRFYTERADLKKLREIDTNFHNVIYEACHSRILTRTLFSYRLYLNLSAHTKNDRREHMADVYQEHSAIFEAFVNRSPDEAAEAMRTHMENAKTRALR